MVEDEAKKIQRRPAKKVTKTRLKNIGLYYLERFESSVDNLRQVLTKRVNDYAFQNPGYDKSEALGWIEELLADFERYGYLNDSRYAELKIRDYLAAGKSARYIKGKLLQKGIGEDEAERLLAEQDYNPEELALRLQRRKKSVLFGQMKKPGVRIAVRIWPFWCVRVLIMRWRKKFWEAIIRKKNIMETDC